MNEQVINKLDAIAAKLGTTAQYLWAVLVRQAHVEIIIDCILAAGSLIAIYTLCKWLSRNVVAAFDDDTPMRLFGVVVAAICVLISVIVALISIMELPTLIANPEYWALKQVLEAIGQ